MSRSDDERVADVLAHHNHRIDPDQVREIATDSLPDPLRELS